MLPSFPCARIAAEGEREINGADFANPSDKADEPFVWGKKKADAMGEPEPLQS